VLTERIVPKREWLKWIRPLCKWTFELSYEVDGEDLDVRRWSKDLKDRAVFWLDGTAETEDFTARTKVEQIREFLVVKTAPQTSAPTKTASAR